MSEVAEDSQREHLSLYFPQLPPGSVLIKHDKPVEERAENEFDIRDLWRLERDELDPRAVDAGAFAVFKARLYDSALTIDETQRKAYTSIREKLLTNTGEIAVVLVKAQKRAGTEAAYCYVGVVPEEVEFDTDLFKDSVRVPGARGFELIALPQSGKNDMHYHGNGPSDALPISVSIAQSDGFSLIPKRFDHMPIDEGRISEFAITNTPSLLTSREIPAKILEEFGSEMAAELIIKLAAISAAEHPEKVTETFGSIPEIGEHLSQVRQLVNDYRTFYDSVIARNTDYLDKTRTLEQIEPDYNALRRAFRREYKALWEKYDDFRSEIRIRMLWEATRGDWPSIDFGSSQPDSFHSPDFAMRELDLEKKEMQARIERANGVLRVLDLLT